MGIKIPVPVCCPGPPALSKLDLPPPQEADSLVPIISQVSTNKT